MKQNPLDQTCSRLLEQILGKAGGRERVMVAIAGPPGAGKSTVAQNLVERFPTGTAALVEMDGFHYDNAVLDELGLRHRKGAPETFDYFGFLGLLGRIRRREPGIAVPVFDRTMDLARAGARIIQQDVRFIIVEGNYLLLDEEPWTGLADLFDFHFFLDVPREELRRRLLQRWLDLGDSPDHAELWVASNDMPNVERVLQFRRSTEE